MIQIADGRVTPGERDRMIVQVGRSIQFIEIDKIRYIEACNYYALIHVEGKTHVVRQTLEEFEKKLNRFDFIRIHRSIIINLNIFSCIERSNKRMRVRTTIGKEFTISRYRQKDIRNRILFGQEPVNNRVMAEMT
jgi:DNA-binding LytR/AlgR family response regulator